MRPTARLAILSITLSAWLPGTARADSPFDWPQSEQQARLAKKARTLKRVGIGLTIAGVALEVATITLWAASFDCQMRRNHCRAGLWEGTIATTIAAPLLFGPGAMLWVAGDHGEKFAVSP